MISSPATQETADTDPSVLTAPGGLTVSVIPDHGARIAQITDHDGHPWLADTGHAELPAGAPAMFADGTRGGWDECAPSVSGCADPNRPGVQIADHGDFWTTPWIVESGSEQAIALRSDIPGHPLQMRKTVTVTPGRESVRVEVALHNRGSAPYHFIYSAHPLWSFEHDVIIDLPEGSETFTAFGPDWPLPIAGHWPLIPTGTAGRKDLSQIPYEGHLVNYKVFIRWTGQVRMTVPTLASTLLLQHSANQNPWLGLCVNRAAYPSRSGGDRWIALEPTTAPTDCLVSAIGSGSHATLASGETRRWVTDIEISHSTGDAR